MIKRNGDDIVCDSVVKAGVPNANGVIYTKECLFKAMVDFMTRDCAQVGVTYADRMSFPVKLTDVSFIVNRMDLSEEGILSVEGKLIEVFNKDLDLRGKLFDGDNENWSMGIRTRTEKHDVEETDDGKLIVKNCKIEAISVIPTKDKA